MSERSRGTDEVPVAHISGAFGIQGEIKCDPTNAGRSLFEIGAVFRCDVKGVSRDVRVTSIREHKGRLLLRVDGVEDANAAEALRHATLYAPRSAIELADNEFLDEDLVGCNVVDERLGVIGAVQRVEHYPASDMLIVNGKMIPMVAAFIKKIDVDAKRIDVNLPEGLLD